MSQSAPASVTPAARSAGTENLSAAEHAADMREYVAGGERRAEAIGNRGPVRFDARGKLHPDIVEAYWRHGFYVFEGVVGKAEIDALRTDIGDMIERAPVCEGATVDGRGRPALGLDHARYPYRFIKPLSDPWGGTDALNGRHPAQMAQPEPAADAPEQVVYLMYGMCQQKVSALRLYGHPELLAIAASINGADFVPYNDAIFVKQAGLGGAVAWHQDGVTHWDSPEWDEGIHGFNFQVQLYPSTAANCLWIIPGTHKLGRADIKAMVADNGGSDRLPTAIPLTCQAGDVTMVNRQIVHGSFANTTPDPRVSITYGFHRRRSVLGARGALAMSGDGVYDELRIFARSAVIAVAIDARHQAFPEERPFVYQPFVGLEDDHRWNDASFERVIRDYNTRDLAI